MCSSCLRVYCMTCIDLVKVEISLIKCRLIIIMQLLKSNLYIELVFEEMCYFWLGMELQAETLPFYTSWASGLYQDHLLSSCEFLSDDHIVWGIRAFEVVFICPSVGVSLDSECLRWPDNPHLELAVQDLCLVCSTEFQSRIMII